MLNNEYGMMDWVTANLWADSLDFNGISGWRLPKVIDIGGDGPTYTNLYEGVDFGFNIDTSNGEMAHMFYDTLGRVNTNADMRADENHISRFQSHRKVTANTTG